MKENISIEKVLNSRCSCDFDGNPKKNHWGTFIENRHPSRTIIHRLIRSCRPPQLSNGKLSTWYDSRYLFLGFEKTDDPFETRLLHIESGMQHEAVYLTCTALGLGTCIHNMGVNGTENTDKVVTARHLILEREDPYESGKFSTAPPGPEKPFKKGKHLSEPQRDGDIACLPKLEQLTLLEKKGTQADMADISQLLWAAKGRTRHYIHSHPWGLTIPTWTAGQGYTSLYIVKGNMLFRYINWTTFRHLNLKTKFFPWWIVGRPTHDLQPVKYMKIPPESDITDTIIIMARNESTNRALWEVGYMLENILLQTHSLGVSYEAKVCDQDEIKMIEDVKISEPVAAILL